MATNNTLFHIDTVVVDGIAIAIVDGSGKIQGALGFENEQVLSAKGDDFQKRKRIPTTFETDIQFGAGVDPEALNLSEVQITARDSVTSRRALMPKCSIGKMGDIGDGPLKITWNVLSKIQWI